MSEDGLGNSSPARPSSRALAAFLPLAAFALLGLLAYANAFGNRALFHHEPNAFADPLLDYPVLRLPALFPKIFTREVLLATNGAYRPLGYALVAALGYALPSGSAAAWHGVMLAVHVLGSLLAFLLLRELTRDRSAAALAGLYLVHPLLAPLVNDPNLFYQGFGLAFSLASLLLYLGYLRRGSVPALTASLAAFAAALLTFSYGLVLPAFLLALGLWEEKGPAAAAALAYGLFASLVAYAAGVPPLVTLAALAAAVLAAASLGSSPRQRWRLVGWTVAPYLALAGAQAWLARSLPVPPVTREILTLLQRARLPEVLELRFLARLLAGNSAWFAAALAAAALAPLSLWLPKRGRAGALLVTGALLLVVTVAQNGRYRDDVTYWSELDRLCPPTAAEHLAVRLNLAVADLGERRWEPARDALLELLYERGGLDGPGLTMVSTKLARAYAGLGQEKLAGYYFFFRDKPVWITWTMKNALNEIADFCFRAGYVSSAEYHWACSLVLDPNDPRLYANLGRALAYKNFFPAAAKHFRYAASLDPGDPLPFYWLAFISDAMGERAAAQEYAERWRADGGRGELDFGPIYRDFRFASEKMRRWFSPNPQELFASMMPTKYVGKYGGEGYLFGEVPLEVGRFFARRGRDEKAVEAFLTAHDVDPSLREPVEELAAAYRRLNRPEEARTFERLLEVGSDAAPR